MPVANRRAALIKRLYQKGLKEGNLNFSAIARKTNVNRANIYRILGLKEQHELYKKEWLSFPLRTKEHRIRKKTPERPKTKKGENGFVTIGNEKILLSPKSVAEYRARHPFEMNRLRLALYKKSFSFEQVNRFFGFRISIEPAVQFKTFKYRKAVYRKGNSRTVLNLSAFGPIRKNFKELEPERRKITAVLSREGLTLEELLFEKKRIEAQTDLAHSLAVEQRTDKLDL